MPRGWIATSQVILWAYAPLLLRISLQDIEKKTSVSKVTVVTNPDKAQTFMLTLQLGTCDPLCCLLTMLNGMRGDSNVLDHAARKQSFTFHDDLA